MTIHLIPVCRLHRKTQLDGAHLRLIRALFDLVARANGPGEIVDVVAVIGDGFCPIRIIDVADLHAAGADDLVLRYGELHVVDAEVGKKFCGRVILMTVPGSVPPHADLGEPLSTEQEIALPSGAGLGLRQLIVKCDFELDESAGGIGFVEVQINNGLVVFVAIVGRDELQILGEIALPDDFDALDVF